MNKVYKALILLTFSTLPTISSAYDNVSVSQNEQYCYSRAMIGLDSVINSRLGVPAEHALELAILQPTPVAAPSKVYSKALLKTILNAYLWSESPHSYAVKVFYNCATEHETLRSAMSNDWIITDF